MATTHAAPHFTPAQLIDAGRRAEAEGRPDLAVRFYAHLTRHYAETAEAAEAHGALGRIEVQQADAKAHATPATRSLPHRSPRPPRNSYATGRALAGAFGVLGWLLALTGPAGVPAYLLFGADPAWSRAELLPIAGGAAGSLVLGFGVVLAAQLARARFDQADAARDLLALERIRLGRDLDRDGTGP